MQRIHSTYILIIFFVTQCKVNSFLLSRRWKLIELGSVHDNKFQTLSVETKSNYFANDDDENYFIDNDDDDMTDEELEATIGKWDDKIARLNSIQLTGRVGNTPEARYFDDGKVVVNLSLATRRKYHGIERKIQNIKMGEEETDWYGLEIWGQTAEFVSKYVDKGARVGVVGQLQVDSWVDKVTGETRNRAKIIVRDFDILETRAEAELRRTGQRGPSFSSSDDDDLYDGPSRAGTGGFFGRL